VQYKIVEGVTRTQERDAAMTKASDYDILRYRTEEEAKEFYGKLWMRHVTNTELNERRRKAWKDAGGKEVEFDIGYLQNAQETKQKV